MVKMISEIMVQSIDALYDEHCASTRAIGYITLCGFSVLLHVQLLFC